MMFQPLSGVRVIDITQVLAGPYCSYLLGLLGAEVIKVEIPGTGDWTRQGGSDADLAAAGLGTSFLAQNAGKKSLALNLKSPQGIDILKRLVADAAIFVENFKPGVAARLGLGSKDLLQINTSLVYASLSAFGHSGPLGPRPAYDHILQAMCGIMSLTGTPDSVPNKVGAPYIDYATGLNGAFAILAGVMEARRTGQGQVLDVAMLDTAFMLMSSHMTNYANTGTVPQPAGLNAFSGSPGSGAYETSEGLILVAANNQRQFINLLKRIGRADLLSDPRFSDPQRARENAEELKEIFAQVFREKSAAAWEILLNDVDVPAAKLRGFAEAVDSEQVAARHLLTEVFLPEKSAPVRLPSLPFHANGDTVAAAGPPRSLGADNEDILLGLGYSEGDIANLRDQGVI